MRRHDPCCLFLCWRAAALLQPSCARLRLRLRRVARQTTAHGQVDAAAAAAAAGDGRWSCRPRRRCVERAAERQRARDHGGDGKLGTLDQRARRARRLALQRRAHVHGAVARRHARLHRHAAAAHGGGREQRVIAHARRRPPVGAPPRLQRRVRRPRVRHHARPAHHAGGGRRGRRAAEPRRLRARVDGERHGASRAERSDPPCRVG